MAVRLEPQAPGPAPFRPEVWGEVRPAAARQPRSGISHTPTMAASAATAALPQRLTVVLPTLNEVDNLQPMVEALLELELPAIDLSVLIVDSSSSDGTAELARALSMEYCGRVEVLPLDPARGLGRAYVAGFGQALADGADLILQMDCDFSHPPHFVPRLVRALLADAADVVLGSRYSPGSRLGDDWPWWRHLLSGFANSVYVRWVLGLGLADATGGFRLWRRDTLLGIDLRRIVSRGYVFQVEMASWATRLDYRITEIPIEFPERRAGHSKMSWRIQLEAAWAVVALRRRHARITRKDRYPAARPTKRGLAQVSGGARA